MDEVGMTARNLGSHQKCGGRKGYEFIVRLEDKVKVSNHNLVDAVVKALGSYESGGFRAHENQCNRAANKFLAVARNLSESLHLPKGNYLECCLL